MLQVHTRENTSSSPKCWEKQMFTHRKVELNSYISRCTKINSEWIKDCEVWNSKVARIKEWERGWATRWRSKWDFLVWLHLCRKQGQQLILLCLVESNSHRDSEFMWIKKKMKFLEGNLKKLRTEIKERQVKEQICNTDMKWGSRCHQFPSPYQYSTHLGSIVVRHFHKQQNKGRKENWSLYCEQKGRNTLSSHAAFEHSFF